MARICVSRVCTKRCRPTPRRALLHYRKNPWVDLERVKQLSGHLSVQFSVLCSDGWELTAAPGSCASREPTLFAAYEQRLHDFYEKCENITTDHCAFHLVGKSEKTGKMIRASGRGISSKILICAEDAGLHGQELAELLTEHYHLELEMASGHYATALTTLMDTQGRF